MASKFAELGFMDWCSDPPTTLTWAQISRGATPTIPDGASGRELIRGLYGDAGFEQAMAGPGCSLKFNYQGNISSAKYFPAMACRGAGSWAIRAALPVFGLRGGVNFAYMWDIQKGCVMDEFTLACAAPGAPWTIDAKVLTSNTAQQSGTCTPAATGAGATFRSTKGGLVTIKLNAGSHAAYRVQSQSYTLRNNPISGANMDSRGVLTDPGDKLWFPPSFEPGDQVVAASLSFKDPIPYDRFKGVTWDYYEVISELTDGTTLQRLTVGPFYRDDGQIELITEGQYIFSMAMESMPNANAWTFNPAVV